MTNRQRKLLNCVNQAIADFNQNECYLIKNDLSERCICAKFAIYLNNIIKSSEFSEYEVDVEYNRGYDGKDFKPKKLFEGNIVVDLIVHKRGYNSNYGFDNLICIEMKKLYHRYSLTDDKDRLKALTDDVYGFGYEIGFMIVAEKTLRECKLSIDEFFCNSNR